MKILRVAFAIQFLFFSGWALYLSTSHKDASVFWIKTVPYDPRDLISGNYVDLRYDFFPATVPECKTLQQHSRRTEVFIEFTLSGEKVNTTAGPVEISKVTTCALHAGKSSGLWAKGTANTFGIEKFFINETSPLREIRSGSTVAKVSLNSKHELRILDLVQIQKP